MNDCRLAGGHRGRLVPRIFGRVEFAVCAHGDVDGNESAHARLRLGKLQNRSITMWRKLPACVRKSAS